jgi:hypothetical protein
LESREKNNWEGKNFALLTQNIGIEMQTLWPSPVKPPVETGFTPSPESRQADRLYGKTPLYKVLQSAEKLDPEFDFGWRSAGAPSTPGFGVMGAVHRCDKRPVLSAGFSR